MRNRGIVAVVVLGLLVAGCAGGSSKPTAATAPPTTKPVVVSNTPKQRAADTALAKAAVLQLADFPLGWTSAPHDPSNKDTPAEKAALENLATCSHLPKRFLDNSNNGEPNANSADFSTGKVGAGPAGQVGSSVEVDRSANEISEPLSFLIRPRTVQCFGPFFRAVFNSSLKDTPGVTLNAFSFNALSTGSLGDQSAAYQGRVTVTGPRASLPVEFDLYFIRVGRAAITLTAITFSVPLAQPFAQKLLEDMIGRLRPGLTAA